MKPSTTVAGQFMKAAATGVAAGIAAIAASPSPAGGTFSAFIQQGALV